MGFVIGIFYVSIILTPFVVAITDTVEGVIISDVERGKSNTTVLGFPSQGAYIGPHIRDYPLDLYQTNQ